jgi:hypothetical protein
MNKKNLIVILIAILLLPFGSAQSADELSEKLKGRILLQVEEKGEAWYVNPDDGTRHFLGRPQDAFGIMRGLGLGISEKNYQDFRGKAPARLAGKILLRVEDKGQAYYVNPVDLKLHYLGRPQDAFEVMRKLGLGISNVNIDKISTWYAGEKADEISVQTAKKKTENFVNNYLLPAGGKAIVGAIKKTSGIYEIEVLMPKDQKVQSAMTLNGEKFFSQVYDSNLLLTPNPKRTTTDDLLSAQAEQSVENYINKNFLSNNNKATIIKVELTDGVFKVVFNTSTGSEVESYLTIDGKKFFPQAIDIEDYILEHSGLPSENDSWDVVPKQARPHVELFVMSHCPYGLQIEKGIIPVLDLLGDKIDFELKFVDYAMHGRKEIDEQLTQACVQENFENKLTSYLKCFSEEGNSQLCLDNNEIDANVMADCAQKIDNEYSITDLYNNKQNWKNGVYPLFPLDAADVKVYGVEGSPTLLVNGKIVASSRDSKSLLKTICSAFINKPAECEQELSTAVPMPGFGLETGGSINNNTCNQ